MKPNQELPVQKKQERETSEESTVPARYFTPVTDIFEDENGLTIVMEMPGVQKDNVKVRLEKNVLDIEGSIDFSSYEGMEPVYTEYNVGHYQRSFSLSSKIDQSRISAEMRDGLLTLILPKAEEAKPRTISIS